LLDRWAPLVGWVFGPVGIVLWLALIGYGLFSIAGSTQDLYDQTGNILNPANLPYLYLSFGVLKLIHELGHGFSVKYFGKKEKVSSEVHTIGLMLMVLTPVPYVDASSAWAFRSKWRRAFVGAAGMYVELACAAIAAIVWVNTGDNAPTAHAIAYNVMFIASVSTLLFNANPLIRFDGYYILSDLAELPNLYQRSKDYLYFLVKKYVYAVQNPKNPAHSAGEIAWFISYGLTSAAYRVFLGVTIVLFVVGQLFFIGMIMAFLAVVTFLLVPWGKWVKYLTSNPELTRTRGRAVYASLAFVLLVAVLVGAVPVPDRQRASALVEPATLERVFAGADGFIEQALATGQTVEPATASEISLVVADNPELVATHVELQSDREQLQARYRAALAEDPALAQSLRAQLLAQGEQIKRVEDQLAALVKSPSTTGTWVSFDHERLAGRYVRRGEPLGVVASLDELIVRAAADQYLGPRLEVENWVGQTVEIKNPNRPGETYRGVVQSIAESGGNELFSPAMGYMAGGAMATDTTDQSGTKATEAYFEVRITPDFVPEDAPPLMAGQRVQVRFTFEPRPLAEQGWLALRQLLMRRLSS
ncbi:MAG: HlyD family efflux transporter periplasmic adaptor subunit, partial [Planctomycetota bacterium]